MNRDKEIIHIVLGKANPHRMNGVNKVVFQLATVQAESGRTVSVWGISRDIEENFEPRNFETRLFRSLRNPFGVDPGLKEAIIQKQGKAVFHFHGGWIPVFSTISGILQEYDIPFVITPHGAYNTIAMQRSRWTKKIYFGLFEKVLLSRALLIHCLGQSEVEGIRSVFPGVNTRLLPYGFESGASFSNRPPRMKGTFIVGFVGRIDIYTKGLDLLLDAFMQLKDEVGNVVLWIVGDGGGMPQLKKMIAIRQLENDVVLWGGKFGKEKEELMLQMDVFTHPSRNEGLPVAVLEASAMGIPSLVTRATNVGEAITRYGCGIAVDDGNVSHISGALHDLWILWNEDKLSEMGRRAQIMVNTEFNWAKLVQDFNGLYHL